MFKEDNIYNETDVGNFIKELHETTVQPLDDIENESYTLVRSSEDVATRSQDQS
tara:strand:- start:41896 stop:42057 length:162 start_codon:yes stop_codon:yes gene_type:complete